MSFEVAVFYLFSAVLVFSAIRVITARNSVHSALFLVLSLFTAAAIWLLLRAEVLSDPYFRLQSMPAPADPGRTYSNTRELGRLLYTDYVYPFELASVILLVAIIAAIALTLRRRKDTKYQDPAQQVAVRRADRVRLVNMPAQTRD